VMTVDDDHRVTGFAEKPAVPTEVPGKPGVTLASMGIYVFNASFLYEQLIRDADDSKSDHDFGKDIIPRLIRTGYRLYAHSFTDSCVHGENEPPYWRDVGTVDAYWEANLDLASVTPDLNLYDREWPIWTYQEQLPPAKFVFDSENRRGMAVDSMVSGGCIISGSTVRQSVLFSNVHVFEGSLLEQAVILPDVRIGKNVTLKRCVIDKGCRIPDDMTIGVDAEQDRKRFYVSDNGVTLVTPEMLGQDMHYFR